MNKFPMIDSHAHVDFDRFDKDRDEVMSRALAQGVEHLIQIAMGPEKENFERGYAIVEKYPHCFMAAGLHPHDADHFTPEAGEIIRSYLRKPKVVALGEIGLDYYYDHSDRAAQKNCFATLMEMAIEEKKPICVHTRDAFDDTWALAKQANVFEKVGGVIHCFTGNTDQARAFLDQGALISFSGVVTFPKAIDVQQAAKFVPLDRMLIETDCPFLAPVPYRGKRNEPSYVVETAKAIAAIKGVTLEEVARATYKNTQTLFRFSTAA